MRTLVGILVLFALGGLACAPAARMAPGDGLPAGGYAALAADPEAFRGREVRLGGEILSVSLADGQSLLSVSPREPDTRGRPGGQAGDRPFLVVSDRFLPPSFYLPGRQVTVRGTVAGRKDGLLLLKARELQLGDYPRWEKYYYPVPREWYDGDPALESWFTPPYFDPWKGGHGR